MQGARILAETQSLTAVRGEVSDPDRGTAAFADTQTFTEARGETSDPDRGVAFAETQTVTKTNNETRDDDQSAYGGIVEWERGERRPLLFKRAVPAIAHAPEMGYDETLDMAVDDRGNTLVMLGRAPETTIKTAVKNEADGTDR
jgi:hypothetical protein